MANPSLLKRMQIAWRIFAHGLPWARKATPYTWPAWREGKPEWRSFDYQSYSEEGFNQNSLIYSSLMYKARAMMAAPLRAYTGELDHPEALPPNHPLSKLLARPNAYQSGPEFHQLNVVYQNLAGNVYILFDRPRRGGVPVAMRSLRPDRVYIIPEKGGLKGYLYVPEGRIPHGAESLAMDSVVPILPEDLMHVRLPNPLDPLEGMGYGLPSISPLAMSADVDNDITRFLKLFFQSGTMMNTLLSFDVELADEEMARIRNRWKEIYGGYENWSEVGVLDRTGKVQRMGMTFSEMGFGELDERNESRILMPFGVPPILLGTRIGLLRSTMANFAESRQHFWQDTLIPEMQLFEEEYKYFLSSEDGAFPAFDLTHVPALQKDLPRLTEAAYRLWQMGVPANIAIQSAGLDVESVPGGEIGFLPRSVQPVKRAVAPPKPVPLAKPPAAEGQTLVEKPAEDGNEGGASAEEDAGDGERGGKSGVLPFPLRDSAPRPRTTYGKPSTG